MQSNGSEVAASDSDDMGGRYPSVVNTRKIVFDPEVLEIIEVMKDLGDSKDRSALVNYLLSTHPEYKRFQKMLKANA